MGRKLYIELDIDWEDYDDVPDDLVLEDVSEEWKDKDGVQLKLIFPHKNIHRWIGWLEKRIPLDDMQKEYIEFAMRELIK